MLIWHQLESMDHTVMLYGISLIVFGCCLVVDGNYFIPYVPPIEDFDLNSNHSIIYAIEAGIKVVYDHVSFDGGDGAGVSLFVTYTTLCWFDTLAPYYPKAVPVMVDVPKRPESEHTERNRNIALLHASHHCFKGFVPEAKYIVDGMIKKVLGEEYDLYSNDTTKPEGIGNVVGRRIAQLYNSNGVNSLGDFGGRIKYNKRPFGPTIKHMPVNSPYNVELKDLSRWQPDLVKNPNGNGYSGQAFITPQIQFIEPILVKNLSEYYAKPHGRMNPWSKLYKETTDEVINEVANLTERKKVASDLFNDKLTAGGYTVMHMAKTHGYSQIQLASLDLGIHFAIHDALIVVWREKARYDAVRPFSAIRYLYKDEILNGYAGPKHGIVNDLPGSEWISYLKNPPHPEYPSVSAMICAIMADVGKLFVKSELTMGLKFPMKKGKSLNEPGVTPKEDTNISYDTWDKFSEECAMTRLWSGVHFKDAVLEGIRLGQSFAPAAFKKIMYHLGETNEQPI